MRALDAIAAVLEKEGKPLHYQDITERILKQGLWESQGKTPWDTITSTLSVEIRKNGQGSRFQRVEPGVFALREWGLDEYILKQNEGDSNTREGVTLSFTDAAEQILQEYSNEEPMHYQEIVDIAIREELIFTQGATPRDTLSAAVYQEIQRYKKRGETPRFVRLGKGMVGLAKWTPTGVPAQIKTHNQKIRQTLLKQLKTMNPLEFEDVVNRLLVALGFEDVTTTSGSNDGGVDVRGTLVVGDVLETRVAVQVKRYKNNVQSPVIREMRGSLGIHEQGLIVTTSDFSSGARQEAERPDKNPIALMNGDQLISLMMEHQIGVVRTDYELFELGDALLEE